MFRLVVLAPLLLAAPASEPFEEGLARVERAMARGRWERARSDLLSLLEEHGDQGYVRLRGAEIEQVLEECAFRLATPTPDPADLVDGDLVSWNESSGKLELRYEKEAGARGIGSDDFAVEKEGRSPAYYHPVHFEGSYTVEISGSNRYVNRGMRVVVGVGEDEAYLVVFAPGRLLHLGPAGEQALLDSDDEVSIERGDRFSLKVKVAAGSISAYYDGKKYLSGKKTRGVFGGFGFSGINGIEEVVIRGEASGSWLHGLVDAHVQREREAFFRDYERGRDLPDWWAREPTDIAYPGAELPEGSAVLEVLAGHLEAKSYLEGLGWIADLEEADVDRAFRDYFRALFLMRLGQTRAALEPVAAVLEEAPDFLPARVLRAEADLALGRGQRAREELEAVLERDPDSAGAFRVLVIASLREGRLEEAEALLGRAALAGAGGEVLSEAARLLARAREGPAWGRVYEYKNTDYVVRSDLDDDVCFEAAGHLQESLRLFERRVRRLQGEQPRFPVYIFAGRSSYLAYVEDVMGGGGENTAGVYSPTLKQLLIWNLPDTDQVFATVRHEGFHQYFDSLVGESPIWLNEGLAEYFETSEYRNSRLVDGIPHAGNLARLRASPGSLGSWEEFVGLDPAAFMSQAPWNYARAWLLAHWLMTDPAGQPILKALLDRLIAGEPRDAVVADLFQGRDRELESALRQHLKSI